MISILIPTMNRADFVIRLLRYYQQESFPYALLIGDSSREEEQKKISDFIKQNVRRIDVRYVDCPNLNNYEVMQQLLNETTTPYACYLADDDFLIPETLSECLNFMETHPDYSGCCGQALLFKLKQAGPYGDWEATSRYPAYGIEANDPRQRLQDHIRNYTSTFHSVCRTPLLKKALRNASLIKGEAKVEETSWWSAERFGELLTSCSLVIAGKIKVLPSLYYVRQAHDQRYLFPSWIDWITSPNWLGGYQVLSAQLVEDFMGQNLTKADAEAAVKEIFWSYLIKMAVEKYPRRQTNGHWRESIRGRLKRVALLKKIWRIVRSYKEEMALEALSKPSSIHYQRFQPIYTLIAAEPSPREPSLREGRER